jgi:hypothetical protein
VATGAELVMVLDDAAVDIAIVDVPIDDMVAVVVIAVGKPDETRGMRANQPGRSQDCRRERRTYISAACSRGVDAR